MLPLFRLSGLLTIYISFFSGGVQHRCHQYNGGLDVNKMSNAHFVSGQTVFDKFVPHSTFHD